MSKFIPLSIPNFEGNEQKYVMDAVEQGWVSTGGAYISKLEEMLAEFVHTDMVAAVQSGTAALHLALRECGVVPGDLVIVPTLTFIAAVNPVRYQFADPVFMDCDDSLCMDPIKLKKFCENECELEGNVLKHKATGKTVRALVVVHVFGNLADMESIMGIAEAYHLPVVEDATEALGTKYTEGKYAGKYAGTIGDYGAFSFNGNKIITTGGGGAVTARDAKRVEHMKYISTQAKKDPHYYIHDEIGFNYRMTNLQGALGVAQMEELPEFIRRKQRNYELYADLLKDYKAGYLQPYRDGTSSNKWLYALVLHEAEEGTVRNKIEALLEAGIQTRAIWGLIHEQEPYKDCMAYDIEKAIYYSKHVINIPCSTQITEEEIRRVVAELVR